MPAPIASGPKKPHHADKTDNGKPKPKSNNGPIINPEADSILGRLTLLAFVPLLVGMASPLLLLFVNNPHGPLFKYHQPIDIGSMVVILTWWYAATGVLFSKRLDIGRELMEKREYKQAVACLEPFNSFGQHFLDRSGEAHYLLAQAYQNSGNKQAAEKCRQFVLTSRPGPWAAKLGGKSTTARAPQSSKPTDTADAAKPRPSKSKPKRRF